MKILKNGDLQPRKFTCTNCGCEFVADMMEYTLAHVEELYCICCPECEHFIIASADEAPIYNKDLESYDSLDPDMFEKIRIVYGDILKDDFEQALEKIKIRERYKYLAEHPYITEEEEDNESNINN